MLYSARISFKIDGEIKSYSHKQKLREFITTKLALQQMLKGLIYSRHTREEKDLQNQSQIIKKMATGTYIPIITLSVTCIKCFNQKTQTGCCCCCCCTVSDSVRPHRWQLTGLLCSWDSPGKNTGEGYISFSNACMYAKLLQSCLTLCDPMDSSPPDSSVCSIL